MDKTEAINKVKAYKDLVKNHLRFEHIYLYGSYAKGLQKEDSDIDVAIVVKHLDGDFFSIHPLLWKLRRQIDDRIEPHIIESDFDAAGFLDEVRKSGIEIA